MVVDLANVFCTNKKNNVYAIPVVKISTKSALQIPTQSYINIDINV